MKKHILAIAIVGAALLLGLFLKPNKAHGQVQTCVWPHTCSK